MRMFTNKKTASKQSQKVGTLAQADPEASDETLINAIASGATWALELLYQRYHRMLYSFAYRMVADHQVAEDILQESFLAVWRRSNSYSAQSGAVRSWLVSIIHHRGIDYLRGVQRHAMLQKVRLDDAELEGDLSSPDVWDEVWQSAQRQQVREALFQLPTEQRMVIELAYFQGWTHSEIAEGCQLPLGTVKARMRLGLLRMKRLLEPKGLRD